MGLLISASAPTQLLALLIALTVTMLPNFFLTGFAFPRSNMPWILQVISEPLPATQYLIALRGIFLKGVGWAALWKQGLWMGATAVALFGGAVSPSIAGLLTRVHFKAIYWADAVLYVLLALALLPGALVRRAQPTTSDVAQAAEGGA